MNENLSLPEDLYFSLIEGKTKGGDQFLIQMFPSVDADTSRHKNTPSKPCKEPF